MTPQRQAVVNALRGVDVHLSADQVLDRVRATRPDTSRATVYNTLNELVEFGEVGELNIAGRARIYDPNTSDPHHHLLCEDCGVVKDVRLGETDAPKVPESTRGFEIRSFEVLFSGRCPECRPDDH